VGHAVSFAVFAVSLWAFAKGTYVWLRIVTDVFAFRRSLIYLFTILSNGRALRWHTFWSVLCCNIFSRHEDVSSFHRRCPQCCLDDVTENLLATRSSSVRLLRVYGEEIEQKQYPLPCAPKPPRRSKQQYSVAELESHPELASIALHNRIREPSNPYSSEIKGLDYQFRHFQESIAETDIQRFVKAQTAAELYELNRADVILCTCSTAGAPRLTRKFNRTWSDHANMVRIFMHLARN